MSIFDKAKDLFSGEKKPIESAQDQPEDDKKLYSYIRDKIEDVRASSNRVSSESIWMTNSAYLMGVDGVFWDAQAKQFKNTDRSRSYLNRNRLRANLILQAAQNRLARLCKNPPRYDVIPQSNDAQDQESARLAIDVLNQVWDEQEINLKRIQMGMWMQQCGHAYMVVSHDPKIGDDLKDPFTGETMGKEGGTRVDVGSAFEFYPDPIAKTLDDCAWVVRAKVRKLDYFRDKYPERGQLVKEEDAWLLSAQYELRINGMNTLGPNQGVNPQLKNAAIELALYERPSKNYPNGRLVIGANGVLLHDGELPCGTFPFVKFDDIVVGGKYYSESAITHARPIQDQYNTNLTKTAQWVNKLLAGKYITAKGHGLIQESINDQSGEVVEYNPVPGAAEPKAMDIPVMPAYVFNDRAALKSELFEVFGLSEVSRGQLPSAGIPAQGMQILIEQDETRIGIEIEQHEHAYAKLGEIILKYEAKYSVTPRKLIKKNKMGYSISTYTGEQLGENFKVRVKRGSLIPNNKYLEVQKILNAYSQGLLGDPADPQVREQVLGMIEFGDSEAMWKDQSTDRAQIQRHIDMIVEEGRMPLVDEMDNHAMFVKTLNTFRKSEDFDNLEPEKQQMILTLREEHLNWQQKLMNPQLPDDDADLDDMDMQDDQALEQSQGTEVVQQELQDTLQEEERGMASV